METSDLVYYCGIGLCILFLVLSTVLHILKNQKRRNLIRNAEQAYKAAEDEKIRIHEKLMTSIQTIHGKAAAESVEKGEVWLHMPAYLLLLSKGHADHIKEQVSQSGQIEQWYYGEHQNRLKTTKYKKEVTVVNGQVTGWRDLL